MYWRCNKVFTETAFADILKTAKTINYAIWGTNYSNKESSILLTYPLFVDYLVTQVFMELYSINIEYLLGEYYKVSFSVQLFDLCIGSVNWYQYYLIKVYHLYNY